MCRGDTYSIETFYAKLVSSDKWSDIRSSRGKNWVSVGIGPCSYSNDIVDITGKVFTKSDLRRFFEVESVFGALPLLPGYSYNSQRIGYPRNFRSFIVASKNISAGAEIFNPYGVSFWVPSMQVIDDDL